MFGPSLTKLSGSPHDDPQRLRPLIVVLGSSLPLSTKKKYVVKVGPPLTKLSGSPHGDLQRLRPACAYAQSDQSLCYSLERSMAVKLLIEQRLEFLSLKGGCTGLSLHLSICHIAGNHMSRLILAKLF